MKVNHLHNWNLSFPQARALQSQLAAQIEFTPINTEIKLIAGIDCAFTAKGSKIIAAAIVLNFHDLNIIETAFAIEDVTMPYIPGLLSFREAPACIKAVEKLKNTPDVFMIDGHGIAHPRRLGLASHLGLFFNKPTIGCAKSRLIGSFIQPAVEKGHASPLIDKNQIIGSVLRTRTNVKPLFSSVGHKCTLDDAIRVTLLTTTKYRLPQPTRIADKTVTKLKTTTH